MHNRFDQFVKNILREGFNALGTTQWEVEVSADAQRIDFFFAPDGVASEAGDARGPHPAVPPIFARMAATSCVVEHYRQPPDTDAVRGCLRKQLTWHHTRIKEVTRSLSGDAGREIAVLWTLSSGRPAEVMAGFAFQPLEGWPPGVYAGPLPAVPFRIVVINELPEEPATLPLRLLGRGATLRRAFRELSTLPEEAWERQHILPSLMEFHIAGQEAESNAVLTEEEKEMIVNAKEFIRDLEDRAVTARQQGMEQGRQEGREQGRQEGMEQGRQEGMEQGLQRGVEQALQLLLHQFARKLGRPVSEQERATLRARFGTLGPDRLGEVVFDLPPSALGTWLADPAAR